MERYLVFGGGFYYPGGGWQDFRKAFNTVEFAVAYARGYAAGGRNWSHVVDTETRRIVWESKDDLEEE